MPLSADMESADLRKANIDFDHGLSVQEVNGRGDPTKVRQRHCSPGPGMLAPLLMEELYDPHGSLFSVHTIPRHDHTQTEHTVSESAPSEEEVRTSMPHPNAYYSPKENGWVILSWLSSSGPPPLAQSYVTASGRPPLPDQTRRQQKWSCLEEAEPPFRKVSKAHHFHKYAKAFDSHKLSPPFSLDEWRLLDTIKPQLRQAGATVTGERDNAINAESKEEEGMLLDLYLCCQCSFYCVASSVIPGVIPRDRFVELVRDRETRPPAGKTGIQAAARTLETFLTIFENKLWEGNNRALKVNSAFQDRVGSWNKNIKRIFEHFNFSPRHSSRDDIELKPPITDPATPAGKQNRRELLRAWLEISSFLADYKQKNARHFEDANKFQLFIQLDSAKEMCQTAMGAHPDQAIPQLSLRVSHAPVAVPREGLSDTMFKAPQPLEYMWRGLGLTSTAFSGDQLVFAYLAQCRCDPTGTSEYSTYLFNIAKELEECGSCPSQLQEILVMESLTSEDVFTAAVTSRLGIENMEDTLGVYCKTGHIVYKTRDSNTRVSESFLDEETCKPLDEHSFISDHNSAEPESFSVPRDNKEELDLARVPSKTTPTISTANVMQTLTYWPKEWNQSSSTEISQYSLASSRTGTTDYGHYVRRMAFSKETIEIV